MQEAIRIWDEIADYWDQQVGEGSDFHINLTYPGIERLLEARPGWRVLDACCGNGNLSRRLAASGCEMTAFDGSPRMIACARDRTGGSAAIDWHVADASDRVAVGRLAPAASLDAAVCSMAIMDLPDFSPLLAAVRLMLRPDGRFVIATSHPAFHSNEAQMYALQDHGEGSPIQTFGLLVTRYKSTWPHLSRGLLGQPQPHWLWHRSLESILRECFAAGFVMDSLLEPAFDPDIRLRSPFSWARRPDLPPVLVFRLRPLGGIGPEAVDELSDAAGTT